MLLYLTSLFSGAPGAESTKRATIRFIMSIPGASTATDLTFLRKEKIVLARVNDTENAGTRFNRLTQITKTLELAGIVVPRYNALLEANKKKKQEGREDTTMSDRQREQHMSADELDREVTKAYATLMSTHGIASSKINKVALRRIAADGRLLKFLKSFQEIVLMACYTWQAPIRNNWGGLYVVTTERKATSPRTNYLVARKGPKTMSLVMSDYKNVASMGRVVIDLSPRLASILFEWLHTLETVLGTKPTQPLYYTFTAGAPKVRGSSILKIELAAPATAGRQLPRIFEKYVGKDISINALRHSWEMRLQTSAAYQKMTPGEKQGAHKQLLHAHNAAQEYNLLDRST